MIVLRAQTEVILQLDERKKYRSLKRKFRLLEEVFVIAKTPKI